MEACNVIAVTFVSSVDEFVWSDRAFKWNFFCSGGQKCWDLFPSNISKIGDLTPPTQTKITFEQSGYLGCNIAGGVEDGRDEPSADQKIVIRSTVVSNNYQGKIFPAVQSSFVFHYIQWVSHDTII